MPCSSKFFIFFLIIFFLIIFFLLFILSSIPSPPSKKDTSITLEKRAAFAQP